MNYYSDEEARSLICEYGKIVYQRGMVAGNEGNISCRTGLNEVWVTPTGESKGTLTEEMLIKTDLEGNVMIEGTKSPSSEAKLHYGVFKENEKIKAVFHTHAPFATAYACSSKQPNTRMLPEMLGLFGTEIQTAKYGKPGTDELPDSVRPYVNRNHVVLLQNHGALSWGDNIKQAYYYMEFLESCCKTSAIANFVIGDANDIPDEESIEEVLGDFKRDLNIE
ncbi:MAG: class II aldolase/adducin family protein [Suipraeoptans sp.]